MQVVFRKDHYIIYYNTHNENYIVYNTNKLWEDGHTHINSLKQAHYLVDCCINYKVPDKVNKYFLVSLIRLSKDKKYIDRIERKIYNIENKQKYYNTPKNFR